MFLFYILSDFGAFKILQSRLREREKNQADIFNKHHSLHSHRINKCISLLVKSLNESICKVFSFSFFFFFEGGKWWPVLNVANKCSNK